MFQGLADMVSDEDFEKGRVFPPLCDVQEVSTKLAVKIVEHAYKMNIAEVHPEPEDKVAFVRAHQYCSDYESYIPVTYPWPGMNNWTGSHGWMSFETLVIYHLDVITQWCLSCLRRYACTSWRLVHDMSLRQDFWWYVCTSWILDFQWYVCTSWLLVICLHVMTFRLSVICLHVMTFSGMSARHDF